MVIVGSRGNECAKSQINPVQSIQHTADSADFLCITLNIAFLIYVHGIYLGNVIAFCQCCVGLPF